MVLNKSTINYVDCTFILDSLTYFPVKNEILSYPAYKPQEAIYYCSFWFSRDARLIFLILKITKVVFLMMSDQSDSSTIN